MTLSRAETDLERILVLTDLFKQYNPATNKYEPIVASSLTTILQKYGIAVHEMILEQYVKQQICFFCGGLIVNIQGVTPDRWEHRCNKCNYLYAEERKTN